MFGLWIPAPALCLKPSRHVDLWKLPKKIATHATSEMTVRYNRGDGLEADRKIVKARSDLRK